MFSGGHRACLRRLLRAVFTRGVDRLWPLLTDYARVYGCVNTRVIRRPRAGVQTTSAFVDSKNARKRVCLRAFLLIINVKHASNYAARS